MPPVPSTQRRLRLQDSGEALHYLHTTPHSLEASVVSPAFGFPSTASSQLGNTKWLERRIHRNQREMCCSKGMNNQGVQGKGKEDVIPPAQPEAQPVPDMTNREGERSPNVSVSKMWGSWSFCEITHGVLVSWSIPHQEWLLSTLSDR